MRPAAIAGSLLVALYALSDFGLVAMMRFPTLTWGINSAYAASFDRAQAATLALLLVVLALIVVAGERGARRHLPRTAAARRSPPTDRSPDARLPFFPSSPPRRWSASRSRCSGSPRGSCRPRRCATIDVPRLLGAVGATVGVALAAAVLAVLLALPIAALASRYRGRLVTAIESVGYLGHALPGIVVGLSLVFFALAVVPSLYQSVVVLVFAYAVLFMPKAIGTMRSGLADVPPRLVSVARTIGCLAATGVVAGDGAARGSQRRRRRTAGCHRDHERIAGDTAAAAHGNQHSRHRVVVQDSGVRVR